MSLEALASAWARQEKAPSGSTLVVANEVSGRLRGGVPWTVGEPNGLMMAVVVRPVIEPLQESLLWLVVTLAAQRALESVGSDVGIEWPDRVIRSGSQDGGAANVTVQLGPGKIEHAVLAVRMDLPSLGVDVSRRQRLIDSVQTEIQIALRTLESDPVDLIDAFTQRWTAIGQFLSVSLLPRGSMRGKAVAIDPNGDLVLESATGMLERVMPANLRDLKVL